jgi:hypothetical protein
MPETLEQGNCKAFPSPLFPKICLWKSQFLYLRPDNPLSSCHGIWRVHEYPCAGDLTQSLAHTKKEEVNQWKVNGKTPTDTDSRH